MVYSSIPSFLLHQPNCNWNQLQEQKQRNQEQDVGGNGGSDRLVVESYRPQLLPLQQQPIPPPKPGGVVFSRPNSTADRARQAKPLPQEEQAGLKCPRCESTNTKFCYYNNYSLSQPRHFCKTCRRYWTRGGSLRNVPVGGGCRKNKRTKTSSRTNNDTKSLIGSSVSVNGIGATASSRSAVPPSYLPLLNSLPNHYELPSGIEPNFNFGGNLMNSVGAPVDYQIGTGLGLDDQWKTTEILYRFNGGEDGLKVSALGNQVHEETPELGLITQSSSVKMEGRLNLQDRYVSMTRNLDDDHGKDVGEAGNIIGSDINTSNSGGRPEYWTDLTGLSTSTIGNLL